MTERLSRWRATALAVLLVVLIPNRTLAADQPALPQIDVAETPISFSLATCGRRCSFTALFAPDVVLTTASVWLTNTSKVPIKLSLEVDRIGPYAAGWHGMIKACILKRDDGGADCTNGTIEDVQVEAGKRVLVRLDGDATNAPPGKYEASVRLIAHAIQPPAASAAQSESPAETPAPAAATQPVAQAPPPAVKTIKLVTRVRSLVWWALLATLAGVIGGRLFQQISNQEAVALMALYERYTRLKEMASFDAGEALLLWWNAQLQDIKAQFEQNTPDAAALGLALKQLEDKGVLIRSIASVQALVNNLPGNDPRRDLVLRNLKSAIASIVAGKLDEARNFYGAAQTELANVAAAQPPVLAALSVADPAVQSQFKIVTPQAPRGAAKVVAQFWSGLTRVLNWLSGSSPLPTSLGYSIVRPIMTLALIVVLSVYGVWQYYSGSDDVAATFGATGIASYAILFLWGFTSQAIAATLQNLKFERPKLSPS